MAIVIEISKAAYDEIVDKLKANGFGVQAVEEILEPGGAYGYNSPVIDLVYTVLARDGDRS